MLNPSLADGPEALSYLQVEVGGVTLGGAAGFGQVPFGFPADDHWRGLFNDPDASESLECPIVIELEIGSLQTEGAFVLSQNGWEQPTADIEMAPMTLQCTYGELVDLFTGTLPVRSLVAEGRCSGSPGQFSLLTYAIGCRQWTEWIAPLVPALEKSKDLLASMANEVQLGS